ncbi:purine nucleoside permease [Opitutaceae bacterium EW11]|nr:purine nucleoside permease [Opitutaceae bacterium EW11]
MFEVGADTGDVPGEFQFWVERMHLDRVLPLPAACHDVRLNADGTVLGIVTGMGNTRAAASIMALGLDPRFDLRESYWLIAGIAGIDPTDGSVGSAVWAHFAVDGDLAHEIDGREAPPEWSTGYIPLDRKRPYELPQPTGTGAEGHVFELNPALVEWAFQLTRDTPLADNDQLRRRRALFVGYPQALRPPFVLEGDNLAASTFWHGAKLNAWANDWVRYYTSGKGNYVTTAMEDTGTLHALSSLAKAGRADSARVLLLRTASNYDMQWPGATAAESLQSESGGVLSGYLPALEAAYAVGRRVVDTINAQWDRFEKAPPTLEIPAR